jgi:hypothetical protein
MPAKNDPGPGPDESRAPWLDAPGHRAFLIRDAHHALDFFDASPRDDGGFHTLDSAGRPDRDEAQLARDAREFRDVLRAAGMDPSEEGAPSSQRKVTWTSHMGLKQNDNLPPWMRPMGYETPNFLAELMTAHMMGGIIHAEITEFQLGVLRKLTKWLKEKQQFTAKVNLVETPDHIPEAWTDDD